jgi:hypothetical protein
MTLAEFHAGLSASKREAVDKLRALVAASVDGVEERIKWGAPSFALGGVDRITLGLDRKGGVRVILHRGVKVKSAVGFAFAAPPDLVTWPASDRGVMSFTGPEEIAARERDIGDVFRRWMEIE